MKLTLFVLTQLLTLTVSKTYLVETGSDDWRPHVQPRKEYPGPKPEQKTYLDDESPPGNNADSDESLEEFLNRDLSISLIDKKYRKTLEKEENLSEIKPTMFHKG